MKLVHVLLSAQYIHRFRGVLFVVICMLTHIGVDGHAMHVRMPNTPGIALRIDIFSDDRNRFLNRATRTRTVHVWNLNLSNIFNARGLMSKGVKPVSCVYLR